jgi:hypothetical protein
VFPTRPGDVPVTVFARILQTLLDAAGAPTQTQLEQRSGVPARTMYRVLTRADRSVSFHVADALLTALDAVHLWHQEPLEHFLAPPPDRSELINPHTPGQERARRRALERARTG